MWLKHLSIKNFRIIDDINVEFTEGVNVIVGPNAAGKTTILEAIRLAKSLLAARTPSEGNQVLISLGAVSPHNPQQLISSGLVRDPKAKLEIRCGYKITSAEIAELTLAKSKLATDLALSRTGQNISAASAAAFLSSPRGHRELVSAAAEIDDGIKKLASNAEICRLDLVIDFQSGVISTEDQCGALFIGHLDQKLPPNQTKFSYFTADRALPKGEVGIQLGSADASQQLESHNSQPQLKYQRLKNTIFNMIIGSSGGREELNRTGFAGG